MSSKRIYSNYTEDEYNLVMQKSREMGFSASAYQRYMTLISISDRNNHDFEKLLEVMKEALVTVERDETFIVSALVPNWVTLPRGTKMALSIALKKVIQEDQDIYEIVGKIPGKINLYRKK